MRKIDAVPLPANRAALGVWLYAVAALVCMLVVVGGVTRMTESGLSIVEWQPVVGVIPPLSARDWQAEFEKYKAIPQYQGIHRGMSLDEFKTIYWWEWLHRLLGRLVGVAFLLPFLCFLWVGAIDTGLRARLWGIFALGALQGAVGWWMVVSGLADRVEVSQYRLATHLLLACVIFAAIVGTAQRLAARPLIAVPRRMRASAIALVVLVLLQIYLGALVAGLRAGLIYNTWPLIDGALMPDAGRLLAITPAWRNLFENALTVQFDHRMIAYGVWVVAVLHAVDAARARSRSAFGSALMLAIAVTLQVALGIFTLINQAPIELALAHQAMAIITLALAVVHAERVTTSRSRAPHPVSATAL